MLKNRDFSTEQNLHQYDLRRPRADSSVTTLLNKNSSELRLVNRHHEESHKDLVLGEVILTSLYCAS